MRSDSSLSSLPKSTSDTIPDVLLGLYSKLAEHARFTGLLRWSKTGDQPEDVQIVDVEFLHFFVPHAAMHHLVDENIYLLRYRDFLK